MITVILPSTHVVRALHVALSISPGLTIAFRHLSLAHVRFEFLVLVVATLAKWSVASIVFLWVLLCLAVLEGQ